jgi:signal transduction histidine kinase
MAELMPDLAELFMASRCSIMLLETPGDLTSMMQIEAHIGLPDTAIRRNRKAGGVAAEVLRHGQPTLIVDGDGAFDTRFAGIAPLQELGSAICAPIATPLGCVFGVLNVSRLGVGSVTEPLGRAELEVCDAIAMLVGDTLERLQSRDAERELRERLRAVEHLSMLGEVAAGIAHEIANPLSSVQSNIVALSEYLTDLAPVFETAQDDLAAVAADLPALLCDVQEGIARVEEIIRNMKSMIRIDRQGEMADVVSLANVVAGVARLLRPRLRAQLVVDVSPTLLAMGRAIDLTQVLMNLVVNADDACDERLRTDPTRAAIPPHINIVAGICGDEAWLEVADNGTGISAAHLARVFQPLFSTKGGKGTGLGLSISQRLMEGLSGRMEIQTTQGAGTTFRLWLPRGAMPT